MDKEKAVCPDCGREYQTYIPKNGDGSAVRLRKHYKTIDAVLHKGRKEKVVCNGSYRLLVGDEWDLY